MISTVFSGPAIISRAWLHGIERRVPGDSPALKAYNVSYYVLAELFGEQWVREYVFQGKTSTFLLNNYSNDKQASIHVIRVITLAEMLINCQWIPGYAGCIKQLETPDMLESTYAELDIARALITHQAEFRFNERKMKRGDDFDLLITFPNGIEVCADTKCKLESTPFSQQTIKNSLDDARKRNLPSDRPGIIFAKIPREWVQDDAGHQQIIEITNCFLRRTRRIVSVKYYTSLVTEDGSVVREIIAWYEISNPHNRFDGAADWRLFPKVSETATSWNGMPPHWKRILKGDSI
jgi:hypothetical protein